MSYVRWPVLFKRNRASCLHGLVGWVDVRKVASCRIRTNDVTTCSALGTVSRFHPGWSGRNRLTLML